MPSSSAKVFISSADMMPRNFDRRYEIMVPILNKTVHKQILQQIMVATIICCNICLCTVLFKIGTMISYLLSKFLGIISAEEIKTFADEEGICFPLLKQ